MATCAVSVSQGSAATRVFKDFFADLMEGIQDPDKLAVELYANDVILRTIRDQVTQITLTREQKNFQLLAAVECQLRVSPISFEVFLGALRERPTLDALCRRMEEAYNAIDHLSQSPESDSISQSQCLSPGPASEPEPISISGSVVSPVTSPTSSAFPYLDTRTMNERQTFILKCRLHKDSNNIMLKFGTFIHCTINSLKANPNVTVEILSARLASLSAYKPVRAHKPLLQDQLEEIGKCTTIDGVFFILRNYYSFFNYGIIQIIITWFPTPDNEQRLKEYTDDFKAFCKRRIFECPSDVFGHICEGKSTLVVKTEDNWDPHERAQGKVLDWVLQLQNLLAEILEVETETLCLCRIDKGCVELLFTVPSFVKEDIFPLSVEQEKSLVAIEVAKMSCGRHTFLSKVEVSAKGLRDETMAQRDSVESQLWQTVKCYPQARGLAVVIANETSLEAQERLHGAPEDLTRMKATFTRLKFVTITMLNTSAKEIEDIVKAIARFKNYPPSYRRIAFTFSGHGNNGYIHTQTGKVSLEGIITLLQPVHAPHLASIPKLFFIDACRGNFHNPGVMSQRYATEQLRPSCGNVLVAYSTLPQCKAFEISRDGGVWMKEVAEKLCTVRKPISSVLIEVNKELLKKYKDPCYQEYIQQPMVVSTLNEDVCLLEEAENEQSGIPATNTSRPKQITIAAVFSNTGPPSQQQLPPQGPIQSVVNLPTHLLSRQLQTQLLPKKEKGEPTFSGPRKFQSDSSSVIQSQTPYADDEEYEEGPSKRKCYKSNLEVTLATNVVVRGSSKFLPSKQLSREEAAKDIVQQMVARGVVTLQQLPSDGSASTSSESPGRASSQLLDVSSKGTVSVPKIYKQKLKEYYDRIGCAGTLIIDYKTQQPSANGGFVSEVTVNAGGKLLQVQGDMCKSKREAEHSAACRALQKLTLI